MLYFTRTKVSEGIDVNKTNPSKKCDICHYFFKKIIVLSFNQISAIDVMIY